MMVSIVTSMATICLFHVCSTWTMPWSHFELTSHHRNDKQSGIHEEMMHSCDKWPWQPYWIVHAMAGQFLFLGYRSVAPLTNLLSWFFVRRPSFRRPSLAAGSRNCSRGFFRFLAEMSYGLIQLGAFFRFLKNWFLAIWRTFYCQTLNIIFSKTVQ